jgi:6-phosphogluconolactonase
MTPGAQAVQFHAHADEATWVDAALASIAAAIAADRALGHAVNLLLSGGGTPVPVYHALAHQLTRDTTVGLVDERWVEPDSPGSNARLLRSTLLPATDNASAASGLAPYAPRFWPLADMAQGWLASVEQANARCRSMPGLDRPTLVLLGMGDDGHTASLFPGCADLPHALASKEPYAALDAGTSAGAGAWRQRITLTPAGWKRARLRVLLLRGDSKRRIFERAVAAADPLAFPVFAAVANGGTPLVVHWCAA